MPTSPLNIAVVGAGNIGSTFAFQLATAGHAVTVVARPGSTRLQQLQRDGAIVKDDGQRAVVAIDALLDPGIPYDLVIVTATVHQVEVLVPALRASAAAHVLCMFNQFDPGNLRDRIGTARCDFGMPFVQASLDADGKLHAVIGAGGQKTRLGDQRWVDLFTAAGLPAVFEPDMPRWLRCHVPLCVAFESIAVSGVRRGGGASWGEAATIARGVKQGFLLIEALGDQLYPAGKARLYASPWWVTATMLWSVSRIPSFRTLLAQGERECCALADIMVHAAEQARAPVDSARIAAMKPPRRD